MKILKHTTLNTKTNKKILARWGLGLSITFSHSSLRHETSKTRKHIDNFYNIWIFWQKKIPTRFNPYSLPPGPPSLKKKKNYKSRFLIKFVLVPLSASGERVGVSRMQDFENQEGNKFLDFLKIDLNTAKNLYLYRIL